MAQQGLVDPNVSKVLEHLGSLKQQAASARALNQPVKWLRPSTEGVNANFNTLSGLQAIHKLFNTDKAESALTKASTPGTIGNSADGIALTLQIDYMQQLERAYRARFQTFPRAVSHVAGREEGHGRPNGPIRGQPIRYFTELLQQGADGNGGEA
jgi:hypothetical protein